MSINAKVITDSISEQGKRITTFQLKYPRFIHAEFMTHRHFCLGGDARLDFELPSSIKNKIRRIYSISLRDFVDKWNNGSDFGKTSKFKNKLDELSDDVLYTSDEIKIHLEQKNKSNINSACRIGLVENAFKTEDGKWCAVGASWKRWRNNQNSRKFSLKSRLMKMNIRQINEKTGEIILGKVKNCVFSGYKETYKIIAGEFSTIASKDHLFLTNNGWKRLEDINLNADKICVYKYGSTISAPNTYKKINGKWVSRWAFTIKDEVAKRQNYRCSVSGELLEKNYHIHHVIPVHINPDLAFDINNVIAVKPEQHKILHKKQGWQIGVSLTSQYINIDKIEYFGNTDTYDLEIDSEFSNFFADGIVVHNSRNASSSRAIPVNKMIQSIIDDTAKPIHWGKNQSGMQAREEHDARINIQPILNIQHEYYVEKEVAWEIARNLAIKMAVQFSEAGYHKQIVNRLLEPFMHINVVCTATELSNFFALRIHPDAQPEIQLLARKMKKALDESKPVLIPKGHWHLPYITEEDLEKYYNHNTETFDYENLIKISVARCARVSYLTTEMKKPSFEEDLALYDRLICHDPIHASPAEHQATPDIYIHEWSKIWKTPSQHGNFVGWIQYRKTLPNECK